MKKLVERVKTKRKKSTVIWLLVLVGILVAGIGVDLFCQRGVLMLPEAEKGTFEVELSEVEADDFQWTSQGWFLTEEDGNLILDLAGSYVGRLEVTYRCGQRVNALWRVWEQGAEEPWILEDTNSLLIDTTVEHINSYVDRINIKFEKDYDSGELLEPSALYVEKICVVNAYQINWYRVVLIWVLLGLLLFFVKGHKWMAAHLAQAYLILALTLGGLMICLVPANKVSWDEEVHFFHAYCVSHFGGEVKTNDILEKLFVADEENWPYGLPSNVEERRQMNETLNTLVEEGELVHNRGRALAGIYTPSYLPAASGIRIGMLLDLPFTQVYQLGRIFQLIFCAGIMAWAIWKIPMGKAILTMIGLLPTSLFLMSMYSYDSFITSLFALGFAFFLDAYFHRTRKISWLSFAVMVFSFAIGSMPKAIYVPLVLVALLLPKEVFKDSRQEWIMKGIAIALFMALMASFVLPVIISPAETNDLRGGNTSEAGQIPYILSDIPRFMNMMVYSISTTFAGYTIGAPVYGSVGHLGLELFGMAIPLFVLAVIFMDEKYLPEGRLTLGARLWILLMCLAVIAMVWVAMYLAFTPVGYDHINGVQARYYIPLLLPIYLCLCPDRIGFRIRRQWLYVGVLAGCVGITATVIVRTMLNLCV